MTARLEIPLKSNARILLIEDNHTNRQLMSDYLRYCGYEIATLPTGHSFEAKMTQFKPHLVLLDLKLPDIDGFTLIQQIRQTPAWRDMPVIVVSAYAFQADQQRALRLGANRYLVKPVKLTELLKAIAEALQYLTV